MSINQNVPTCVAAGTNNGCRPVAAYMNNSQYRAPASRTTTACTSRTCSGRAAGRPSASTYTLSKSMNNLGEAFFSSPTDPTNVHEGLGPVGQRPAASPGGSASVNSPTTPATTPWEHLSHGFQASTMLQYYSSLPFNIVSGVNSLQGTRRPALRRRLGLGGELRRPRGRVHPAQRRHRQRLLHPGPAPQPIVHAPGGTQIQGLVEAFNLTDRANAITRNTTFGPGSYPVDAGVVVQHRDRGRRSADAAVRRAVVVLEGREGRRERRRDHHRGTEDTEQRRTLISKTWRRRSIDSVPPCPPFLCDDPVDRLVSCASAPPRTGSR